METGPGLGQAAREGVRCRQAGGGRQGLTLASRSHVSPQRSSLRETSKAWAGGHPLGLPPLLSVGAGEGTGRVRQGQAEPGKAAAAPAGSWGQPSAADATAPHGCDSNTAPAQTCRGGACRQLGGVRQPSFGQRWAARQGLCPALPRSRKQGRSSGRTGSPSACSTTTPQRDPGSPGSCSTGPRGYSQPRLLLRRPSGMQPAPAWEREDSHPSTAARTQPSHLPAISSEQRAPVPQFPHLPPCKCFGSHHTEPRAGEALQAVSNSTDPKPGHPPKPFCQHSSHGKSHSLQPPQGCTPLEAPQDNSGPPPAPPAPVWALSLHQGRRSHWRQAGGDEAHTPHLGVQDPTPQRSL